MKHRSPAAVFFLPFITFGIYGLVWQVKTKNEMNKLGADVPTAWLLIVPVVSLYWYWKYAGGVEKVTGGKQPQILVFILLVLLGVIGAAIVQSEFNKVGATPVADAGAWTPPAQPAAPLASDAFAPVAPVAQAPDQFAASAPAAPVAPAPAPEAWAPPVATPAPVATTPAPLVEQPAAPVAPAPTTTIDPTTGLPVDPTAATSLPPQTPPQV